MRPGSRGAAAAKAGAKNEACGEPARPAEEPYKSIVAQLNDIGEQISPYTNRRR